MRDQRFHDTSPEADRTVSPGAPPRRLPEPRPVQAKLPALPERVLSLDAVMELARTILRPAPSDGDASRAEQNPWSRQ
jgi:hypothetical protein